MLKVASLKTAVLACSALFVLAVTPQSAVAAPITFSCQDQPPFVIKVDLDNATVVGRYYEITHKIYNIFITDDEISWNENPEMYFKFTLSRVTGNLHQMGTGSALGVDSNYLCRKAERQF